MESNLNIVRRNKLKKVLNKLEDLHNGYIYERIDPFELRLLNDVTVATKYNNDTTSVFITDHTALLLGIGENSLTEVSVTMSDNITVRPRKVIPLLHLYLFLNPSIEEINDYIDETDVPVYNKDMSDEVAIETILLTYAKCRGWKDTTKLTESSLPKGTFLEALRDENVNEYTGIHYVLFVIHGLRDILDVPSSEDENEFIRDVLYHLTSK